MLISFEIGSRKYAADMARGIPLAIPLRFDGPQPTFFGVPQAKAAPVKSGGFVGDVRQGGSCNVQSYHLVPHCNGTHTECIGHMVEERVSLPDYLPATPVPATLVSVTPKALVIDATTLQAALLRHPLAGFHRALILRTLPNGDDKLTRQYEGPLPAAYLGVDAAALLVQAGVEHLLLDVPSLDPAQDEGRMAAHRVFWGMPATGHKLADARRPQVTVTEMIYVPDAVPDGYYLLDLQIPAFMTDAAPSRPVIYPVG
ncbi:MAG TPA: cyclase family protein [Gammaproteobacteria bacterium]|nr:cyclase family protein [Gammaproteobacteria bacterium]